jgi:hypothetical protein
MPQTSFCGIFTHLVFPASNGIKIPISKIYQCKTRELLVLDIPCINLIAVAVAELWCLIQAKLHLIQSVLRLAINQPALFTSRRVSCMKDWFRICCLFRACLDCRLNVQSCYSGQTFGLNSCIALHYLH